MDNNNLIIVTSKDGEKYGEYLSQLISDYDGIDAALWNENEYRDNRPQLSSSQFIVFVGKSKAENNIIGIKYYYDDGVIKIGWKGNKAVITSTSGTGVRDALTETLMPTDIKSYVKKTLKYSAPFGAFRTAKDTKNNIDNSKIDQYKQALEIFVEEYLQEFMKLNTEDQADSYEANSFSAADEIYKFKELCDAGIITEEEFEAKKCQLLGL